MLSERRWQDNISGDRPALGTSAGPAVPGQGQSSPPAREKPSGAGCLSPGAFAVVPAGPCPLR